MAVGIMAECSQVIDIYVIAIIKMKMDLL